MRLTPILSSLWFTWLIFTLSDFVTYFGAGERHNWNYVPNAVFNLFTPILIGNLAAKGSARAVILAILLFGLLLGEWLGKQIKFTTIRVAYNLLILVSITATIDTIAWGSPLSIERVQEIVASWRSSEDIHAPAFPARGH